MSSVSSISFSSPSTGAPVLGSRDPSTPATESDDETDGYSDNDNDEYVLVTGGLGFIGSHTSLELLKAGYNIIIVDNLSNSFRDVFNRILLAAKRHYESLNASLEMTPSSSSNSNNKTKPNCYRSCPKAELVCADYRDTSAMSLLFAAHSLISDHHHHHRSHSQQRENEQPTASRRARSRTNITGVIHFAAWKDVAESLKNPLKYYQNNVKGLIDFMILLDEYDIKSFIFSSSASVYGTLAEEMQRLREEHCVHETVSYDPNLNSSSSSSSSCSPPGGTNTKDSQLLIAEQGCTGITNPYGRSKFFGEAILSDLCHSDPSWTVVALRYFNPIGCDASGLLGEDPRETPSNLVPVAIRVLTGQDPELCIYGTDWDTPDGTAVRDFIHVSDLARGHIAALSAARDGRIAGTFRTFNLGTGEGHSVIEVVQTLEAVSQRAIPTRLVGRRAGDVGLCVAIPDRAGSELGWKTEKSLRDACQDLWNSLLADRRV